MLFIAISRICVKFVVFFIRVFFLLKVLEQDRSKQRKLNFVSKDEQEAKEDWISPPFISEWQNVLVHYPIPSISHANHEDCVHRQVNVIEAKSDGLHYFTAIESFYELFLRNDLSIDVLICSLAKKLHSEQRKDVHEHNQEQCRYTNCF